MTGVIHQRTVITGLMEVEVHEVIWNMDNFQAVLQNRQFLEQHKLFIETGRDSDSSKVKWEVGIKSHQNTSYLQMYFTLKEILPAEGATAKHIHFVAEERVGNGAAKWTQKYELTMQKGDIIELPPGWERFRDAETEAVTMFIRLSVLTPRPASESELCKVDKKFRWTSDDMALDNITRLMESADFDVKIVCKDGVELKAHRAVLMANSAVFEKMLTSGLSEQTSGIINVADIESKALQILLDFLYTGKVQRAWSEKDVVVEFTYAAGKYEITQVLGFLDVTLGTSAPNEEMSAVILTKLYDLTTKLELKEAEKRLKQKLVKLALAAQTEAEMISIFQEMELNNESNDNVNDSF